MSSVVGVPAIASSDANGIISGLVDTYTLTGYSFDQFVNDMKNGKPEGSNPSKTSKYPTQNS